MLSKLTRSLVFGLLLLTPFFYWTLTPNFFSTPKETILLVVSVSLLIIYAVRIYQTKTITLPASPLTFPLLAFFFAIILNLILNPEGRPEALASKGAMLLILPLLSLFLLTQKNQAKLVNTAVSAILGSTLILSIYSLLHLIFLYRITTLPLFMQTITFTPTGSYLTTLTLLLIGAAVSATQLKHSLYNKSLLFLTLLLNTVASVAIISLMFPGGSLAPNLIPYMESWSISLDALKSVRTLFVGIGLANFSLLYTAVKPLSLNLTPLWNALPQNTSSELLTMLATTGLVGALSLIYLMVKSLITAKSNPLFFPLLLTVFALLLTPGSIPLYLLFFTLLALSSPITPQTFNLSDQPAKWGSLGFILLLLVLTALQLKPLLAEIYMRQAQIGLIENNGKVVYENHQKALSLYPKMTAYHLSLAEVNLNIASALSQKTELTDSDKNNISSLVQQGIQEAKTAISLRPNYVAGWTTLAKVYRNLIGIAEGSEEFAIQSYSRAVILDPANPALRVEYGGLYYQLALNQKDPSEKNALLSRALQEFQVAVKLKKDYANAYYNYAKTLELAELYPEAVTAMEQVVAYTTPDTQDYQKALSELEAVKAKVPKNTPAPQKDLDESEEQLTELATPSPLPSPLPDGPLDIPVE